MTKQEQIDELREEIGKLKDQIVAQDVRIMLLESRPMYPYYPNPWGQWPQITYTLRGY